MDRGGYGVVWCGVPTIGTRDHTCYHGQYPHGRHTIPPILPHHLRHELVLSLTSQRLVVMVMVVVVVAAVVVAVVVVEVGKVGN